MPSSWYGNGSNGTSSCRPSNRPSSGGWSRYSSRSLNSTVSAVGRGRMRGFARGSAGRRGACGSSTACRPAGSARRRRRRAVELRRRGRELPPLGGDAQLQLARATAPTAPRSSSRASRTPGGERLLEPRQTASARRAEVEVQRYDDARASVGSQAARLRHPHLAGLGHRLPDAGERLGQVHRRVDPLQPLARSSAGPRDTAPTAAAAPTTARVGSSITSAGAVGRPERHDRDVDPRPQRQRRQAVGDDQVGCVAVFSTSVLPIRSAWRYSVRVGP